MADIRTPDKSGNYGIQDVPPADKKADSQPWNKSQIEVEPAPVEGPVQGPSEEPRGRFNDRIKISPMKENGAANKRAVGGWREGQKKV
jgi:hypothetical protein